MPSITTTDGVRLDFTESGVPSGRPVVLVAGFKAAATSWKFQVPALAKAGYRVLAVDLRGHGTSQKPDFGHSMARRGEDIHDFLVSLDLHDTVLVGGSMGGNTIWSFLEEFGSERVAGIVIVDQTPKMLNTSDWEHGFYGYDESNVDTAFAAGIPSTGHGTPIARRGIRLVRLVRAMDLKGARVPLTPGELTVLDDHAKKDWRGVIAAAEVPILFVAGAESEVWPSTHAAASAALNPLAGSVVIEHDGHATNVEQPKDFNASLLDFIRSLSLSK